MEKKPRDKNPGVDVPPSSNQPEALQERIGVVEAAAPFYIEQRVRDVVGRVESDHRGGSKARMRKTVPREKDSERDIPGILVKEIQEVLLLSDFRCGSGDPRQFSIDAVENLNQNR